MNIIDFYKQLSKLLTDTREDFLSKDEAKQKLEDLLEKAEQYNLDVNINSNILDMENLMRLDDERSFEGESSWETDSYESDSSDDSDNYSTSY